MTLPFIIVCRVALDARFYVVLITTLVILWWLSFYFSCVRTRILAKQAKLTLPSTIEAFVGPHSEKIGLPFQLEEYLELVDWTGRILRDDKRGAIPNNLPNILERLEFNQQIWAVLTKEFEAKFSHWVGSEAIVKKVYHDRHYQRIPKGKNCATLLS